MRFANYPSIDTIKLKGVSSVNIYVVNSKFDKLSETLNIEKDLCKQTYNELYELNSVKTDRFSKYIIISDEDDDVIFCSKIKIK